MSSFAMSVFVREIGLRDRLQRLHGAERTHGAGASVLLAAAGLAEPA